MLSSSLLFFLKSSLSQLQASHNSLVIMKAVTSHYERKIQQVQADAVSQQQENNVVQQHIDEIGTPQSTQRIAQEELDLYPSDAVIFETTE